MTIATRSCVGCPSFDVDMLTAPRLEGAIQSVLRQQPTILIVDLTRVQFLASVGN